MFQLASRQVHLDFHNSEWIPGIGQRFNKENFQRALLTGHVNSITVFAKCHHSWSYYPTTVGRMHPSLNFDLLKAMIDAAHEIGVKAPIYITVGWSANDAENHPEWLVRDKSGNFIRSEGSNGAPSTDQSEPNPTDRRPIVSWNFLCPNGEYANLIYAHTREICDRYEVDGLFYDICFHHAACWCETCKAGMAEEGLDPEREDDAKHYHMQKWQRFMTENTRIIREKHPNATIFFNGGADPNQPQWHAWQTHYEMEDLPTTWGGYDKLPARAKYFARSDKPYLGMTGKFHTMWGEFGGFKSANALRYECAAMAAYGARCSVGDQLHPGGEMDMETYRLIGDAYRYVQQIEPWCYEVRETTRLGIVLSGSGQSDEGLVKMLLERQMDFDIVMWDDRFDAYDTLILPDCVQLDEWQAARINLFIADGGSVLLTGDSGLNSEKTHFVVDVGAAYQGPTPFENDYLQLGRRLGTGLMSSPFLFYEGARRITATDGEELAVIRDPYFNRTYSTYSSHQNTPYTLESPEYAGAVRKGNVVYLAHAVCRQYFEHGAQLHRDYLIGTLQLIYTDPVLRVGLRSSGRARFVQQPQHNRYVLHLLYATPIQRGRTSVIEDLPPQLNVRVEVKIEAPVRRVYLAPHGDSVPFSQDGNRVKLTVAQVKCHQIVVFECNLHDDRFFER